VAALAATLAGCASVPLLAGRLGGQQRAVIRANRSAHGALALVMSSGTVRGVAHIGVLKALEREGLRPELIVGASVGAFAASGTGTDQMREIARSATRRDTPHPALLATLFAETAPRLKREARP